MSNVQSDLKSNVEGIDERDEIRIAARSLNFNRMNVGPLISISLPNDILILYRVYGNDRERGANRSVDALYARFY